MNYDRIFKDEIELYRLHKEKRRLLERLHQFRILKHPDKVKIQWITVKLGDMHQKIKSLSNDLVSMRRAELIAERKERIRDRIIFEETPRFFKPEVLSSAHRSVNPQFGS